MERRKESISKPSPLPIDYLNMISEVFATNFDQGLKIFSETRPNPRFEARGEITSNEVVVAVSLVNDHHLATTTVYASCDFDPKASAPSAQDLLEACIDAIGTIFGSLLVPEHPETITLLAEESLSAMENVPFHWTLIESNQYKIYVKLDKANLLLDELADDWLEKHDPQIKEKDLKTQKEVEDLFFTGPKSKKGHGSGSGIIH